MDCMSYLYTLLPPANLRPETIHNTYINADTLASYQPWLKPTGGCMQAWSTLSYFGEVVVNTGGSVIAH